MRRRVPVWFEISHGQDIRVFFGFFSVGGPRSEGATGSCGQELGLRDLLVAGVTGVF